MVSMSIARWGCALLRTRCRCLSAKGDLARLMQVLRLTLTNRSLSSSMLSSSMPHTNSRPFSSNCWSVRDILGCSSSSRQYPKLAFFLLSPSCTASAATNIAAETLRAGNQAWVRP